MYVIWNFQMGGHCKEWKSALSVMKYESFSSHECSTYTLFKLNSLFLKKIYLCIWTGQVLTIRDQKKDKWKELDLEIMMT